MIRIGQKTVRTTESQLRVVGTILVNWFHKNDILDFLKIESIRRLILSNPAQALKCLAEELVNVVKNSTIITEKENEHGI